MKFLISLALSFLSLSVFAFSDPQAAYSLFKEGKAVIVDVREADELKFGMINGAEWLPLSTLQDGEKWKEEFLTKTKGKTIFLYCRTGNRSAKAQTILKENSIHSENIGGYESLKDILPIKVPTK